MSPEALRKVMLFARIFIRHQYKNRHEMDLMGCIQVCFQRNKINLSYPQTCEFVLHEIKDLLEAHAQA